MTEETTAAIPEQIAVMNAVAESQIAALYQSVAEYEAAQDRCPFRDGVPYPGSDGPCRECGATSAQGCGRTEGPAHAVVADARAIMPTILALIAHVEALRESLEGYRAACGWIAADSWDGCPECMLKLRAARTVDWDWQWTPDEHAAALARLRERMNDIKRDGFLARATLGETKSVITLRATPRADVAKLREALELTRNTVGDLRKGFAPNVDPERWVEQVQASIDAALASQDAPSAPRADDAGKLVEHITDDDVIGIINVVTDLHDADALDKAYPEVLERLQDIARRPIAVPPSDDVERVDIRGIALAAIKRAKQAGESNEMLARWISEDVNAAIRATPRADGLDPHTLEAAAKLIEADEIVPSAYGLDIRNFKNIGDWINAGRAAAIRALASRKESE